jgi:hypothetical protein
VRKYIAAIMIIFLCASGANAARVTYQIQASSDDTAASLPESVYAMNEIYVPYSNLTRLAFWRWPVHIPKEATIVSAYLWLKSYGRSGDGNSSKMNLQLVSSDDCPDLSSPSTVNLSTAGPIVTWTLPSDWRVDGGPYSDGWYKSPDIKGVVDSFIKTDAYKYGNYLGIRGSWASGSWKTAYQYDGNPESGARLEINYEGGEAILNLDMAEPHVRIAQKIYCKIGNVDSADILEVYLDDVLIHKKIGNLKTEEMFIADYRKLKAGDHILAVKIVDSSGKTRGSAKKAWRTLHTGIPKWGINENNALCKNGIPFFPITSWMLDKQNFNMPIASMINTLLVEGWYAEHNVNTWLDYLDTARMHKWNAIGPGRTYLTDESIANFVNASKKHPALMGWFLIDEPELGPSNKYTKATILKRWTDLFHQYDTDHPVFVNFNGYYFTQGGWKSERIKEYTYLHNANQFKHEKTALVDVVMLDYYPYEYGAPLEDYALALDRAREWNYDLFPMISFIETQDIHDASAAGHSLPCGPPKSGPWTPDPTPEQLWNLIWVSIIHGAKGLSYFHYFCPIPENNLKVLLKTKAHINDLAQVILSPDSKTSVTNKEFNGDRVDIMSREYNNKLYIFAANMRNKEAKSRFHITSLTEGAEILVYGERSTIKSKRGYFEDAFGPLGVHIYIVDQSNISQTELKLR